MLCDERFIRLLLIPVVLHMIWNLPDEYQLPLYGNYILVGAAGWFVCISLVQEGLHEVAEEQAGATKVLESYVAAEGGAQ